MIQAFPDTVGSVVTPSILQANALSHTSQISPVNKTLFDFYTGVADLARPVEPGALQDKPLSLNVGHHSYRMRAPDTKRTVIGASTDELLKEYREADSQFRPDSTWLEFLMHCRVGKQKIIDLLESVGEYCKNLISQNAYTSEINVLYDKIMDVAEICLDKINEVETRHPDKAYLGTVKDERENMTIITGCSEVTEAVYEFAAENTLSFMRIQEVHLAAELASRNKANEETKVAE